MADPVRRGAQRAVIRCQPPGDQVRGNFIADPNVKVEAFAGHVEMG